MVPSFSPFPSDASPLSYLLGSCQMRWLTFDITVHTTPISGDDFGFLLASLTFLVSNFREKGSLYKIFRVPLRISKFLLPVDQGPSNPYVKIVVWSPLGDIPTVLSQRLGAHTDTLSSLGRPSQDPRGTDPVFDRLIGVRLGRGRDLKSKEIFYFLGRSFIKSPWFKTRKGIIDRNFLIP